MNIVQFPVTSANYTTGREGKTVTGIVLHTMVGTWEGAQARFNNPASEVSVHYGVDLTGTIHQWVDEANAAWQAGNYPVNLTTIGIEHEDNGNANDSVRTDALYEASAQLVADICKRYRFPADSDHIFLHKNVIDKTAFPGGTACPDALDTNRIISMAAALLGTHVQPSTSTPTPPAPAPEVAPAGQTLTLPASAATWRVYNVAGPYTVGSEVATLRPAEFGGLTYTIEKWLTPTVAQIHTRDFGDVAIYVAPETEAVISASAPSTEPVASTQTLYLPASAPQWHVYNVDGPYTLPYATHTLAPAEYGGLTYAIDRWITPGSIAVITTQMYGQVAIYVAPETGAVIK